MVFEVVRFSVNMVVGGCVGLLLSNSGPLVGLGTNSPFMDIPDI